MSKTKPQRWNEIARAAVILGLAKNISKGEMHKVSDILERRMKKGKVLKIKKGKAQSSAAFYVGKY